MAKTIGQLLQEADLIITEKVAAESAPAAPRDDYSRPSEKVASLIGQLQQSGVVKEAGLVERVVEAVAIMDTVLNLPTLAKMAALEKKASDAGIPEAKVSEFLEKHASVFQMKSIVDLIPWLAKA